LGETYRDRAWPKTHIDQAILIADPREHEVGVFRRASAAQQSFKCHFRPLGRSVAPERVSVRDHGDLAAATLSIRPFRST